MDVVCERCQTEYEFDDALVSERGTTVKCTNCGHQFKIYRPASGPGSGDAGSWSLRRPDGTTITFDSLAVLQKWIMEGRVTRTDEISRDNTGWKPLGSIAELESFFASAELRPPSMRASTMSGAGGPRKPSGQPPPVPSARSQRPPASPVGASVAPPVAAGGTLRPGAPALPAGPPASAGLPAVAASARSSKIEGTWDQVSTATASPGYTMGSATSTVPDRGGYDLGESTGIVETWGDKGRPAIGPPPASAPPPTVNQRRPSASKPLPAVPAPAPPPGQRRIPSGSEDDPVTISREPEALDLPARSRRGGSGALVGVAAGIVLTLGGLAIAWRFGAFGHGATEAGPVTQPDQVREVVERASAGMRTATRGALDDAAGELTALLVTDPSEPRLRATRAEAFALLGEKTRQHADDLEARAARPGATDAATQRAEAALNRRDVTTTLERAAPDVAAAEAASARVTDAADRVRFHTALGEAARVLGDLSAAHRHLDRAREAGGGPEVDLLAGLLARDESNATGALEALRAAATHRETAVRAHLALARWLASQGDATGARAEALAASGIVPDHEEAVALTQAIAAGEAPFRAAGAAAAVVVDAGTRVTVTPRPDAGAATAVATGGGGGGEASGGGGGGGAGRSYDSLVGEADRAQSRGQRDRARELYNTALASRPDGSEAITGLGWVELRGGSATLAINHFRRALSFNPRYSEAFIGLGEAYQSLNDFSSALHAYREYLEINPGGSQANTAQQRIDVLQRRMDGTASPSSAPSTSPPVSPPSSGPTFTPGAQLPSSGTTTAPPSGATREPSGSGATTFVPTGS